MGEKTATGISRMLSNGVRFRHLGLGFVWAWIYCAFETPALFPDRAGIGINSDASWIVSSVVVTIVLFLAAFLLRNRRPATMTWLQITGAVCASIGTLSSVLPWPAGMGMAGGIISGLLTGTGTGLLVLLWFDALCNLNIEDGEVAVCLSTVVVLVCTLIFPYLSGVIGALAVSSLPLISGFLLVLTYGDYLRENESGNGYHQNPNDRHAVLGLVRAVIVVGAAYFVMGGIGAFSEPSDALQQVINFDLTTCLGTLVGIAVMVVFIRFSMRTDFTALFRWVTPLLIICAALFPWDSTVANFVSEAISTMLDTVLQAMSILCVIALVKQRAVKPVVGAGLCQGIIQLFVLLGNVCGAAAYDLVFDGQLHIMVVSLVLICLYAVATTLLPRRGIVPTKAPVTAADAEDMLETEEVPAPTKEADPAEEPARNDAQAEADGDPLAPTCARLASEHGLSAREEEILLYLAHGRSQPFIREQLVLSKNTVATHVKHIYQKLDVHSKQELIDLF